MTTMKRTVNNKHAIAILVLITLACAIYFLFTGTAKVAKTSDVRALEEEKFLTSRDQPKITSDGHYLPFYGYTIIAPIVHWNTSIALQEYIEKSKMLSKFISPLPASSYHVTIFEIFSEKNVPHKYKAKSGPVPSVNWYRSLGVLKSDLVKAQEKCNLFNQKIKFQPQKLRLGKTALTAIGTLSNIAEISKLRQKFTNIFKTNKKQTFHLGLGYIYTDVRESDMEEISKELKGLWNLLSRSYLLHLPNVYYFETMEKFIPYKNVRWSESET